MKKKQKIKKTLKTLTISRRKWGKYSLLNSKNKMCCLGFACTAVGYDLKELNSEGPKLKMPEEIKDFSGPKWMVGTDAWRAAGANDDLYGEDREHEVRRIFAKHGCKVRFTK